MRTLFFHLVAAATILTAFMPAFASTPAACGAKSEKTGKSFRVTGEHALRAGPSAESARLVNHRATEVLGRTYYLSVDNSFEVVEQCRENGFSRISTVEPEWLRESHRGWMPSSALRAPKVDAKGMEQFSEADFDWSARTRPHKKSIVDGVNMLRRTDARCRHIDTGSADLSTRSTSTKPVFYVTCGKSPPVNVFFTPQDVARGRLE